MEEMVPVLLEVAVAVRKLVLWEVESGEDECGSECVYGAFFSWGEEVGVVM